MEPSTVLAAGMAFGLAAGTWLGAYVTRAQVQPPASVAADPQELPFPMREVSCSVVADRADRVAA